MTKVNDYDSYAASIQEELQKGVRLPHAYVEKPAMRSLLKNLEGKSVLMLGCGTGEESQLLEEFGATSMIGIDSSAESIRLARKSHPKHSFGVGDMQKLEFDDESFDFIYSSLAVHYSPDPQNLYREMYRLLKPGGSFQFSTVHPMRWGSERLDINGVPTKLLGYSEGDSETKLYGSYLDFHEQTEVFPNGEIFRYWVGPPSLHFNLLKAVGFSIEDFIETRAVKELDAIDHNYFVRHSHFPQFVVYVANKPA